MLREISLLIYGIQSFFPRSGNPHAVECLADDRYEERRKGSLVAPVAFALLGCVAVILDASTLAVLFFTAALVAYIGRHAK